MARLSHDTAAGARLGAGGIVPQRSISVDMEIALSRNRHENTF